MSDRDDLTALIQRARNGDPDAAEELFAETYADLRRLARARLRGGGRNTLLDTGALVHESYLRFAAAGRLRIEDRTHFMRWASRAMRSVIVDHARRRLAARRGGGAVRLSTDADLGLSIRPETEILAVHEGLERLASVEPRLVQVVELRYFGGMTELETAQALGITDRTVRRDWDKARLLLRALLT